MHHPHDQRFKALMAACLELVAEVERAVHVPPQRIDVAYEPRGDGAREPRLGLVDRMAALGPGMMEYYSRTPSCARVDTCFRKRLDYAHERTLSARRRSCQTSPAPRLWILSTGRPRRVLDVYEARPMDGWPDGLWQTRAQERLHFVVLRDLPETPDTLLLRLLGRGRTVQRALQELSALPVHHVLRARALPVMVAFRAPILQDLHRSGDMNALQQAQALYQEWVQHERSAGHAEGLSEGRKEGRKEGPGRSSFAS